MFSKVCCWFLILMIYREGIFANTIHLSPTQIKVVENSSAILTCSDSTGNIVESRWINSNIMGEATVLYLHGNCTATKFLNDNEFYAGVCNGNGTYSVLLKRINRTQHDAEWKCRVIGATRSNGVTIHVSVPASSVRLIRQHQGYMKENQTELLTCNTSACRPDPRVQWYLLNSQADDIYNLTQFSSNTQNDGEYGLKAIKSILNFKPNKTVNGFRLYCEVWTRSNTADKRSTEIILNVTYPPDDIPKINDFETNSVLQVIELETVTFVCSVTDGNPLASLRWNCFGSNDTTLNTQGNTVSSTVKWTAFRNYNTCSCIAQHISNWERTSYVIVNVQYSPERPQLTIGSTIVSGDVHVIGNNTLKVVCKSKSNPLPNFTWRGPDMIMKDNDTLEIGSVKMMHQGLYKCTASNRMTSSDNSDIHGSNSSSLKLIMLYPPSAPKLRFGNMTGQLITSNSFNVVKRDTFTIYCDVDGNPSPNVTWDDNDENPALRISSILSDLKITCNATNVMKETAKRTEISSMSSASLSINVFYPPGIPTINVSNVFGETVQGQDQIVSIIESETIFLTCFATSKPSPIYKWFKEQPVDTHSENMVTFQNITRNNTGKYTCIVENSMKRTIGETEEGKNKSKITLNILYPASVDDIQDKSVLEGSRLEIVCPVMNGNPSYSSVTWYRPIDESRWDNKLYIKNVSRTDDSDYTCSVITEMLPTIGNDFKVAKNQSFHLNVFFKSEITRFSLNTLEKTVVINKMDNASLLCIAEANPPSSIAFENPNGDYISEVSNSNIASHTIWNASYIDAGEYTCRGRNNYTTGLPSSSNLILIVKCPPRPSSGDTSVQKVATVLHVNVTLKFLALNYLDEPNKTVFSWFKEDVSLSNNDSKYIIHTDGLQTNLSIRNISQNDLGLYRVNVTNSAGSYIHNYTLKATASLANNVDSKTTDNSSILVGSVSAVAVIVFALTIIGVVFFLRKRQNTKSDRLYQNVPFIGKANYVNDDRPKLDTKVQKKIKYSSQTEETETTFKGNSSDGKRKITKRTVNKSKTDETGVEGLQEVDDVPIILNERTEYFNSKDEIDKIKRITVAELYAYVFGNEDDLEVEYQKLPTGLQKPCTFARKPENIALNRYNGIYPYDHSRVKISEQPDFFINACYIDGFKRKKAYIASLGPTSKTTSDFKTFWQMIWHERSDLIIMLTNLHELSGMKCEQYWPDEGTELLYGNVLVISKTTDVYTEYTVRTFEISKGNDQRPLTHLHYTAWPDKTVPEDVTSLLEFRRRMRDVPSTHNGPAVIHCSAGIGRTGTLIALDILIEEGLDVGSVNVFECVNSLRDQRVKMVQTLEQYVYIHKALVNSLSFECETFTRKSIQHHLDIKNDQHYSKLFKQLNLSVETNSATEQKERTKNTKYSIKNRQGADIPGDRFRVFLQHTDGREGSDYINAVYVNSFKRKDHFITAQTPLPNNVTDFISMIYHGDCSCIATMEDLKEPGMAVGAYLPEKNKAITFGNFEVTCSKFEENTTCVIRKMKIKYTGEIYSGEKCFYHFQYTKWMTGNKTPGDVEDFVQFVQAVEEYADELGEDRSRVVVHCLKANERSCLFCALAIIMEKLKVEGSVNILNVVRHLRTRRRSAIVSKEQLKFCYEAASAYAKSNKH